MPKSDPAGSDRDVASRLADSSDSVRARWRFRLGCLALVFPLTAILHQTIFFPKMCMLNKLGADYTPDVIAKWLSRDPSLALAVLFAWSFYRLADRYLSLRVFLIPFLIGFAPLCVWVWDIPFTGRAICASMHDKQIVFPGGGYLRNRHLYILGAIVFGALSTWFWLRRRRGVNPG